jgi:hypothetical protein
MAFTFRPATADGTPADPPAFQTVAPMWRPRDTIPLGPGRAFRVVGVRVTGVDETPVLIVEDMARTCLGTTSSAANWRSVGSASEPREWREVGRKASADV